MFQHGFRPSHGMWIDTYNHQFGRIVTFTILSTVGNNNYFVVKEL